MQVAATTFGHASQMPAIQTNKDGSLTEETPGQGCHSLGPDSSTNLGEEPWLQPTGLAL